MSPWTECCVAKVVEPVRLLFRGPLGHQVHECFTVEELESCLTDTCNVDNSDLVISVCQKNSWRSLQISPHMLELIFSHYNIDQNAFGDIPCSFYERSIALEEGFCIPCTQSIKDTVTEVAYTTRYPEFKEQGNEWVTRQTGIYHRFDASTGRSVYLLFSPTTNSKAHLEANEFLQACDAFETKPSPMWLHQIVASAYLPAWRQYLATQERDFLQIVSNRVSNARSI
jgi:hypothetical protein